MNKFSLCKQIAVITGSSSGIGSATAELFSQLGASVLLTGRDKTALENVKANCERMRIDSEQRFGVCVSDLSEPESAKQIAGAAAQFSPTGHLNILISDSAECLNEEALRQQFQVNVFSLAALTELLAQSLIRCAGNVVNVSSVAGHRAFPNLLSYCMSKGAVDQLTKAAGLDLASKGVRVNSVNPGTIRTNLHLRGGYSQEKFDAFLEKATQTHALGRFGEPEEVAACIAFLASPAASFVTGAILPVCGGRHMMTPR